MTDIDIDGLKAKAEKATPGPLSVIAESGSQRLYMVSPADRPDECVASYCTLEDAEFLAAARDAVPALIAQRAELLEENKRLKAISAINETAFIAARDRAERLHAVLEDITAACEKDCGVPGETDFDDEAVGAGEDGDMALTFGMLRAARSELSELNVNQDITRATQSTGVRAGSA